METKDNEQTPAEGVNDSTTTTGASIAKTPKAKSKSKARKKDYLVNGRYEHLPFGGIAMPPHTVFYGFATVRVTEDRAGYGISEETALEALKEEIGRPVQGLVVESLSALPAKW